MTAAQASPRPLLLNVPAGGSGLTEPLTITAPDAQGSYTIPYVQAARHVRLHLQFAGNGPRRCQVRLLAGATVAGQRTATPARPRMQFRDLAPGEYTVELTAFDGRGEAVGLDRHGPLGVGTVLCAIGDSITEGYYGHGFWRDDLNLRADVFPTEAVSRDGRNFPQYSPTTSYHLPDINCFQSWMTDLNDLLADRWRQPVFIANEGYGGITSGAYLDMMRTDAGWQGRMRLLRPTVWLIHLGVNDERYQVTPEAFAANIEAIADLLLRSHGARADHILIARPCYDYAEGYAEVERAYIGELDKLIARRGFSHGPDFFAAYGVDKAKWYGDDPVHPNLAGVEYMAQLWAEAITAALPKGACR